MEGYPATAACSRGGDSNLSYRITNPSFNTHNIALGLIHLSPSLAYGSMYLLETERAKSSCTGSSFMEISHPKMFCHELTVYKGDRIAAYFVKWLGKSTLRLSYGLALSEALIAPAMPNTMARVGGEARILLDSILISGNCDDFPVHVSTTYSSSCVSLCNLERRDCPFSHESLLVNVAKLEMVRYL
ncbi:hypothetical protein KY290_008318 [Solanum tuberosum]|uniref:Uncharacterized protein n=1 Tax=Solanum tuberosum TaxID=4113 RepID=A0ABQ7W853_SOLTU|nr:hypothetical protein KY290_008318 [Solanum tuberosum]